MSLVVCRWVLIGLLALYVAWAINVMALSVPLKTDNCHNLSSKATCDAAVECAWVPDTAAVKYKCDVNSSVPLISTPMYIAFCAAVVSAFCILFDIGWRIKVTEGKLLLTYIVWFLAVWGCMMFSSIAALANPASPASPHQAFNAIALSDAILLVPTLAFAYMRYAE
jgi:hypothetical protein